MSPSIEFAKLSGSGNDFICIDARDGRFDDLLADEERLARFAAVLCDRHVGVGADGVIFAFEPDDPSADIAVRFLEPDGSEAELCGNGSACLTRWAIESGWVDGRELRIRTISGAARGRISSDGYTHVCIPEPRDLATDIEVTAAGRRWRLDYALTGVPHAVAFVDDVEALDVERVGGAIRHHERFAPRGVNVNFTQVVEPGLLAVRTFEFGVEGETLACGTGAATAALMAALRFGWPEDYLSKGEPVRVRARSGDVLKLYLLVKDRREVEKACLESVVRFLFQGQVHADLAERALGTLARQPCAALR